jgi:multidrug efflux pump subunit AcrB
VPQTRATIVMTTAATVADAGFRQPMALAVIGGLITSTALSLLVVPVVFVYVHGFGQRLRHLLERRGAPLDSI